MKDHVANLISALYVGQTNAARSITVPVTRMIKGILDILYQEGLIRYYVQTDTKFIVYLKYARDSNYPAIFSINQISKRSCRIYAPVSVIKRNTKWYGLYIINTSYGIVSDRQAIKKNIGGEILCSINI